MLYLFSDVWQPVRRIGIYGVFFRDAVERRMVFHCLKRSCIRRCITACLDRSPQCGRVIFDLCGQKSDADACGRTGGARGMVMGEKYGGYLRTEGTDTCGNEKEKEKKWNCS